MDKQRIQINIDVEYGVTDDKNIQVPPMVFDSKIDPFDYAVGMAALQRWLNEFDGLKLKFLVSKLSVTWDFLVKENPVNATIKYTRDVIEKIVSLSNYQWEQLYFVSNRDVINIYKPVDLDDFIEMVYKYRFEIAPEPEYVFDYMVDAIQSHTYKEVSGNQHISRTEPEKTKYGPEWVNIWMYSQSDLTYQEWVSNIFRAAGKVFTPSAYFDSSSINNLNIEEWIEIKDTIMFDKMEKSSRLDKKRIIQWTESEMLLTGEEESHMIKTSDISNNSDNSEEPDPIYNPHHTYNDVLLASMVYCKSVENLGDDASLIRDNYFGNAKLSKKYANLVLTGNQEQKACDIAIKKSELLREFMWSRETNRDVKLRFEDLYDDGKKDVVFTIKHPSVDIITDYFDYQTYPDFQENIVDNVLYNYLPEAITELVENYFYYGDSSSEYNRMGAINTNILPEHHIEANELNPQIFKTALMNMRPAFRSGAVWIMHSDIYDQIKNAEDIGQPLIDNGCILYKPIIISDKMPKLYEMDRPAVLLVNLKKYGQMFFHDNHTGLNCSYLSSESNLPLLRNNFYDKRTHHKNSDTDRIGLYSFSLPVYFMTINQKALAKIYIKNN